MTAWTLVSRHNLAMYATLMQEIREAIMKGELSALHNEWMDWK
jgi:tRNA-guanine family transglycosylase